MCPCGCVSPHVAVVLAPRFLCSFVTDVCACCGRAAPSPSDSGLSGGAKAGIAIGVIIGVLAIAGGVFVWRRKSTTTEDTGYEQFHDVKKRGNSNVSWRP